MVVVKEIEPGSLGDRAGFLPGDQIQAINGQPVGDLIDFQVNSAEEFLLFEVRREGEDYEVEVERAPAEQMGLGFEDLRLRSCNNKCVFCFIHQMPKGMRRTLYFEDDDYRLSFLHGSYVTLTNVQEKDLERIIDQGLSPQYISVHATDPQLRQVMLGRKKSTPDIMDRLRRLAGQGIEMHTQVVVCPGYNDGAHLQRTVADLSQLYPAVRSVALVPVGLTRFREHLPDLEPVTPELAHEYVRQAETWGGEYRRALGERLVYAADELFLITGRLPPPREYYDAFPQIENGIGMVRSFLDRWEEGKGRLPARLAHPLRLGLVTGQLAGFFMAPIAGQLNQIEGLEVELLQVTNDTFGPGITVSGLLSGEDILGRLEGGHWDLVLLPPNCINGEGLTLDDLTLPLLRERAGIPIAVGQYDLPSTLEGILAGQPLAAQGSGRQLSELGYYVGRP
jgi:putative radical SAM enzyme (TIGR03279 family)